MCQGNGNIRINTHWHRTRTHTHTQISNTWNFACSKRRGKWIFTFERLDITNARRKIGIRSIGMSIACVLCKYIILCAKCAIPFIQQKQSKRIRFAKTHASKFNSDLFEQHDLMISWKRTTILSHFNCRNRHADMHNARLHNHTTHSVCNPSECTSDFGKN